MIQQDKLDCTGSTDAVVLKTPPHAGLDHLQLHTLAELAPIGIFKSDVSGANLYTNLAWQEISGLSNEQSLGNGWLKCVHADDLHNVMGQWSNAPQTGTGFQFEFRVVRPDAEIRFVRVRARPVTSQVTKETGYISSLEDVTELRKFEQHQLEYSRILECSLNEIFIFDAETLKFEFVNESACRNLGYTLNELRQMTPVDIKPNFDLPMFEATLAPLRASNQELLVFQTIHRRSDGSDYNVEIRLQMSMLSQRPVFLAIILDITERLQLEAEKEKTNALQRAILEHAAYAIISTSPEGIITNFNPAAERLLEYSASELVGRHTPALFHLESEVIDRASEFSNELGIELEPGFEVFVCKSRLGLLNEHSWTYVRKNGTRLPVMLGITALKNDAGNITGYLGIAKDIKHQKDYEEKLATAAVTDTLTGLPNRVLLLERLRNAITGSAKRGTHFACMFLDFDRFKTVNDSWGHDVGDELLRQIADRLRNEVQLIERSGRWHVSIVARLGGDEFVVVVEGLEHAGDSIAIAQQLEEKLSLPYQLGPYQFCSTASIGIVNGPGVYDRGEDILRDADTAMYEAKHAGRARHVVFDNEMHTRVRRRMQLENELRDAIGTNQLSLHYQPIVSLFTGQISAVEALLRWQNPKFGSVGPAEFIPIAQDSDLILQLGNWVLEEGCQQLALWQRTLGCLAPQKVSINLARKQFENSGLPKDIAQLLEATGLKPNCLQLEVTEEAFAMNVSKSARIMRSIRELGVLLAIDDFGSGTASFVALHQFPVDVLKIDRSLIRQIESSTGEAALLHGLVVMARNLNIKLVAEGIETLAQLRAVQELGCEFMQGFYFARPMSAENMTAFLSKTKGFQECCIGAMGFANGWTQKMAYLVPATES